MKTLEIKDEEWCGKESLKIIKRWWEQKRNWNAKLEKKVAAQKVACAYRRRFVAGRGRRGRTRSRVQLLKIFTKLCCIFLLLRLLSRLMPPKRILDLLGSVLYVCETANGKIEK